jgi:hypothetical protein
MGPQAPPRRSNAVMASGTASIDMPTIMGFNPTGDAVWVQFVEDGQVVWRSLSTSAGTLGPH